MQNTAYQPTAKRSQQLNAIKRFLQSDHPLMLIIGEQGCGKTTILDNIILQIRLSRPVLRLPAHLKLTPSQLTQALTKHWAIYPTHNYPRLESQLDEMLNSLNDQKQPYTLIIDNAHLLTLSVLAALSHLTMKQQEKNHTPLHILLAGHPILAEKMNNLQTKPIPQLTLGTLSREAAFRKIQGLLNKANLQLPHSAANAIFTKLFQQSKGMPETLENMVQKLIAQCVAADQVEKKPATIPKIAPPKDLRNNTSIASTPTARPKFWQSRRSRTLFLLSLSLIGCAALWLWQHHHHTSPKPPYPPPNKNINTFPWSFPENLATRLANHRPWA